ncbi:hypothetical protein PVAP13_9KG643450 [Panicum virgatum]|uniref:Uncharacterized protein n=1 Tax=Panicum virgatum TaxID=38727 RepID=A0A8T0P0D9_PANVG|nr:hypothetical protein PVAP13_9KG643450 [Panicum virgatum]
MLTGRWQFVRGRASQGEPLVHKLTDHDLRLVETRRLRRRLGHGARMILQHAGPVR